MLLKKFNLPMIVKIYFKISDMMLFLLITLSHQEHYELTLRKEKEEELFIKCF